MKNIFILSLIFAFSSLTAIADDEPKGTMLNLSATEMEEVENDLLVSTLRFEQEGKDPREIQNIVNSKMQQALDLIKKYSEIKAKTENYNIYKFYPDPTKQTNNNAMWRASQGLSLKSKSSDDLLKLIGELQSIGLLINGLDYIVSPEKQEQTQDAMMEKALQKLTEKAKRAAKAIGKNKVEFINININTNNYYPAPMYRNYAAADMASKEAFTQPVATPGQSQINLMVNAQVRLSD